MREAAESLTTTLDRPEPRRPDGCPVEDWLAFLGHRWNALVLWHLRTARLRHHELTALLPGISPKVLSERLTGLEQRGLIAREQAATFPRAVRYQLTESGQTMVAILDQVELWTKTKQ